jgi:hypothetical protein
MLFMSRTSIVFASLSNVKGRLMDLPNGSLHLCNSDMKATTNLSPPYSFIHGVSKEIPYHFERRHHVAK